MKGSIVVYVCDRCGKSEEQRKESHILNWGGLIANAGERKIGTLPESGNATWSDWTSKVVKADLCPDCSAKLFNWFNEIKVKNEEVAFTTLDVEEVPSPTTMTHTDVCNFTEEQLREYLLGGIIPGYDEDDGMEPI